MIKTLKSKGKNFMKINLKNEIIEYIMDKIGHSPEYLWEYSPSDAIFRSPKNRKWYALLMQVKRKNLGLSGEDKANILNVKCSPATLDQLLFTKGFLPAYHMNKKHWITVLLDGSVEVENIHKLILTSLELVENNNSK